MYLILLGPPGTGKGTQAKRIAQELGLVHIATGDMLREAVSGETELGKQAKAYMDRGDLVPDDLMIAMLLDRIAQPDAQAGALLDGYPRTLDQARALDEALKRQGVAVDAALHITASDEEIIRRLSGRWLCGSCGEIYHETERPPERDGVCDRCGKNLAQREDDRPDVVRRRLERQRPPRALLEHYGRQSRLLEIDGEQDVEAVTRDLLDAIKNAVPAVR